MPSWLAQTLQPPNIYSLWRVMTARHISRKLTRNMSRPLEITVCKTVYYHLSKPVVAYGKILTFYPKFATMSGSTFVRWTLVGIAKTKSLNTTNEPTGTVVRVQELSSYALFTLISINKLVDKCPVLLREERQITVDSFHSNMITGEQPSLLTSRTNVQSRVYLRDQQASR